MYRQFALERLPEYTDMEIVVLSGRHDRDPAVRPTGTELAALAMLVGMADVDPPVLNQDRLRRRDRQQALARRQSTSWTLRTVRRLRNCYVQTRRTNDAAC